MWYYRTEVRNTTDSPLHVVWFEAYSRVLGKWSAGNIKGRTLTHADFREWYSDEDGLLEDGAIPPGGAAICSVNWHGSWRPWSRRVKWAFKALDQSGEEYYAEAALRCKAIVTVKSVLWLLVLVALGIYSIVALYRRIFSGRV